MKCAYLLIDSSGVSGGHRVIFEQVRRLAKRGHDMSIWSAALPCEGRELSELLSLCEVPIYQIEKQPSEQFDVVVFTDIFFIPEFLVKFPAKKYYFLVQHDLELVYKLDNLLDDSERTRQLFNNFPSSCEILSISTWVKNVLYDKYKLNSILLPNGINSEIFYPAEPILKQADPSILLYYDRQIWKGFSDALTAAELIKQKIKNCRILIFGTTWPEPPIKIDPGSLTGFSWSMTYFCKPSQKDLVRLYSSATVFVSSSWYEGFGLLGLEAMACGTPVVTTDSGGVRDYAINEENCLIVPPRDPQAIAEAVIRVIGDEKLRQKFIKNGLKKAKEFDWEKSIDILEKVFKE